MNLTTRTFFSEKRRRCTMICVTILLCYLFTCCTHQTQLTLAATSSNSQQIDRHHQNQNQHQHHYDQQHPPVALPTISTTTTTTTKTTTKTNLANGNEGGSGSAIREELVADGRQQDSIKQPPSQPPQSALDDYEVPKFGDWRDKIRLEDLKHDNVHKLMSEQDLRRTFQVDSHNQVPEYEILKLTVNPDGSHLISPISDLGELTTSITKTPTITTTTTTTTTTTAARENPAITTTKTISASSATNNDNNNNNNNAHNSHLENKHHHDYHEPNESSNKEAEAAATTTTTATSKTSKSESARFKRSAQAKDEDIEMKVSIFGKVFHLRLKRNADFQQRIKDMKMFMAESTKDGQLRYTEIKNHHHPNNNNNSNNNNNKQEAHKRAAASSTSAENAANIEPSSPSVSSSSSSSPLSGDGLPSSTSAAETSATQAGKETSNADEKKKKRDDQVKQEQQQQQESPSKRGDHISSSSAANVWNIGSTYHDEDNLAALLIDHDRKTGQLQVDGTIGNDFVIKPMPQATIDALVVRQQQELLRNQQRMEQQLAASSQPGKANSSLSASTASGENNNSNSNSNSNSNNDNNNNASLDLERKAGGSLATAKLPGDEQQQVTASRNKDEPASLAERAMHMHDDDPHDDDEMFLDEDEALELAHLQSTAAVESNHRGAGNATSVEQAHSQQAAGLNHNHNQSLPQQQQQLQPRALSKAASERKWKKYRKLMAQTQVPKPGALTAQAARERRHAEPATNESGGARQVRVSHHIVYRQKPSAEGSSSDHQHSFMISPGQYSTSAGSMEQMALNFSPQRLIKRSVKPANKDQNNNNNSNNDDDADDADDDNMIDGHQLSGAERLARLESGLQGETDFAHDPLGGQFYLEPGTMTGIERAGYSDWSLLSSSAAAVTGRRSRLAPPPYALNGSDESAYYSQQANINASETGIPHNLTDNYHHHHHHHHHRLQQQQQRRFKRQTRLSNAGQVRRKRQAPDTVWPEVLLVVDYDSFLLHGGDSRDVKRYFVSFWNGVDLRYKLLVHPHIRISLAGMIVAKDRDATPYLERNRLRAPNADAVDAAGALTDMGKYLYREDRLPTYDLAVVITKLDMCRRRYEGGRCNRGTAGFAYVGGACVVNKRLEKVNSVAIIEDSGGFSGIIVAAHEVGHLLGCVHDGSPPPSYLGGPGATHCPWEDGFIMSDLRHTERGFRWSQCSVEQFKHFLNGETATCLYNYPHESQVLHRLLPGTMLTLDEQCKRDRGTNACFKDARVCAQLFCFDSASGYCVSYRPAAEGSPCGESQVCRNGKCVGEIENIIPDYTHQSHTVVARRPHSVTSRLADNGLSASSTSTATSSPDSKFPPPSPSASSPLSSAAALSSLSSSSSSVAAAAAAAGSKSTSSAEANSINPTNQLISRMDTFPIDTPLGGTSSSSASYSPQTGSTNYPFGGRHSGGAGSSVASDGVSLIMLRQAGLSASTLPTSASPMQYSSTLKNGKLVSDGSNHSGHNRQHSYQQRSGHQAFPKGANQPGVVTKHYQNQHNINNNNHSNNNNNYNQHHHHNQQQQQQQQQHRQPHSSTGLYTSASTMSHQYPSSSPKGNNLLTSISTNPVTTSKKQQQQQQQQQFFDNQRIMYHQPISKHTESYSLISTNQPQNRVNRNQHVNVNHPVYHNGHLISTSSSRLYNPLSQTTTVTS